MFNYDGKRFVSTENSEDGEVGAETVFDYRQSGTTVWATYCGGSIRFGTLIAIAADDGILEMRYQHIHSSGEFRTGKCRSVPERLLDGRIRLHESWQWTSGQTGRGASVIEEQCSVLS